MKAGDGIRTHDVQLGNSGVGEQVPYPQVPTSRFSVKRDNKGSSWMHVGFPVWRPISESTVRSYSSRIPWPRSLWILLRGMQMLGLPYCRASRLSSISSQSHMRIGNYVAPLMHNWKIDNLLIHVAISVKSGILHAGSSGLDYGRHACCRWPKSSDPRPGLRRNRERSRTERRHMRAGVPGTGRRHRDPSYHYPMAGIRYLRNKSQTSATPSPSRPLTRIRISCHRSRATPLQRFR
jgi:hypothetical protein